MRVYPVKGVLTDHAGLAVLPDQHHPPVETISVIINGTSLAPGTTPWTTGLTYSGHKLVRGIFRSNTFVDTTGFTGAYVVGTDASAQSAGFSMVPSGIAGYPTTYMGGYSRLHGDSYLSGICFGSSIVMKDISISGSLLRIEFTNISSSNQLVYCYGLAIVK